MSGRVFVLALILLSVGLNAAAQLFLRSAMRGGLPVGLTPIAFVLEVATRMGLIAGLACYGFSLLVWIYVLSKADASFAYPFLGLGFVIVAIAGYAFLGEPMTTRKMIGTFVIASGIIVLAGG